MVEQYECVEKEGGRSMQKGEILIRVVGEESRRVGSSTKRLAGDTCESDHERKTWPASEV